MNKLLEPCLSSKKHDYETPQMFFDALDSVFGFSFDLAASAENAKCPRYFDESDNSLQQCWDGPGDNNYWLNPPHGRMLPKFMCKCAEETHEHGNLRVVALTPARPDTRWWESSIWKNPHCDVCFVRGRLRFGREVNLAPFPSAVVIFGQRQVTFDEYRRLIDLDIGHWIWRDKLPR